MKVSELAEKIDAHLKRMEADPAINVERKGSGGMSLPPFYEAHAYQGGGRVMVSTVNFQGTSSLTKEKAEAYLAWLDEGNNGSPARAGVL